MLDILSTIAFVMALLGMLFVVVRAVREQGYWRLLFVLVLVSFALEVVAVLVSPTMSDTMTYLGLAQTGLYLSAVIVLGLRRKPGIALYALSSAWTMYDNSFHAPSYSAIGSFAESLTYAVDGAVVLLAWVLMTTDLAGLTRQKRLAAAF